MSPFVFITSYLFAENMRLSCTAFNILRYSESFVKRCCFPTLRIFHDPVGGDPSNFHQGFWQKKTSVPSQSHSVVCVMIGLDVLMDL